MASSGIKEKICLLRFYTNNKVYMNMCVMIQTYCPPHLSILHHMLLSSKQVVILHHTPQLSTTPPHPTHPPLPFSHIQTISVFSTLYINLCYSYQDKMNQYNGKLFSITTTVYSSLILS